MSTAVDYLPSFIPLSALPVGATFVGDTKKNCLADKYGFVFKRTASTFSGDSNRSKIMEVDVIGVKMYHDMPDNEKWWFYNQSPVKRVFIKTDYPERPDLFSEVRIGDVVGLRQNKVGNLNLVAGKMYRIIDVCCDLVKMRPLEGSNDKCILSTYKEGDIFPINTSAVDPHCFLAGPTYDMILEYENHKNDKKEETKLNTPTTPMTNDEKFNALLVRVDKLKAENAKLNELAVEHWKRMDGIVNDYLNKFDIYKEHGEVWNARIGTVEKVLIDLRIDRQQEQKEQICIDKALRTQIDSLKQTTNVDAPQDPEETSILDRFEALELTVEAHHSELDKRLCTLDQKLTNNLTELEDEITDCVNEEEFNEYKDGLDKDFAEHDRQLTKISAIDLEDLEERVACLEEVDDDTELDDEDIYTLTSLNLNGGYDIDPDKPKKSFWKRTFGTLVSNK